MFFFYNQVCINVWSDSDAQIGSIKYSCFKVTRNHCTVCSRQASLLCSFHVWPLQSMKCTRMQKLQYLQGAIIY